MLKKIIVAWGLMLWTVFSPSGTAQADLTTTVIILHEGDQLNVYRVDTSGGIIFLKTLDDFYIRGGYSDALWEIARNADIVLSPDQSYLAFTAFNNRTGESALHVHHMEQTEYQTQHLPGLGRVVWSPDSQEILVAPPSFYMGRLHDILTNAYLYDLKTHTLTPFGNQPFDMQSEFLWLPDSTQIVYTGAPGDCTLESCIAVRDVYAYDRQLQRHYRLTDLRATAPEDLVIEGNTYRVCAVRHLTWSANNARLYYSLDCQDSGEFVFSSLYSVDFADDNRLEGRLIDYFPDDIRSRILDIHVVANSSTVYIVAVGSSEVVDGGFLNIVGHWRILQNVTTGTLELILEHQFPADSEAPVQTARIAPDAAFMALAGGRLDGVTLETSGYLAVIDLDDHRLTEYETGAALCELEWVNNQLLHYQLFESSCSNAFRVPMSIWQLNIDNGIQTEITPEEDLGD